MANNISIQIILDLKLCRICAINKGVMYLFDNKSEVQPSAKIMHCTNKLEIFKGDGFPEYICTSCLEELNAAYEFVIKCEATNMKLNYLRATALVVLKSDAPEVKIEYNDNIDGDDDLGDTIFKDGLSRYENHEDKCDPDILESNNDDNTLVSNKDTSEIKLEIETERSDVDCQDKCNSYAASGKKPSRDSLRRKVMKTKRPYKIREPIVPGPYICKLCKHKSRTKITFLVHMKTHKNERPFACKECDKTYLDPGSLYKHTKMHHGEGKRERQFICEHCGKGFYNKTAVIVHLRTHTGEKPYSCTLCPKKFNQIGSLNQHTLMHTGRPRNHKCSICSKGFSTKTEMKRHQVVHSEKREQHLCPVCNKTFKAFNTLQKHLNAQHKDPNSIVCSLCGRRFNTIGALKYHMERWHSNRSGFCETCSKNVTNLEVHTRKHTGEKPLKCEYCDATFSDKKGLSRHTSHKHLYPDKYECNLSSCTEKFPSQLMLQFHIDKYHKRKVSIKCDLCSRGFYRKSDYTRHKLGTHKVH